MTERVVRFGMRAVVVGMESESEVYHSLRRMKKLSERSEAKCG